MAYETKTLAELEDIVVNLRLQIALHPEYELEKVELKECEQWLELRRREQPAEPPRPRASAA